MSKHNGQIVENILRRHGHNLSDVSKSLNINRRSLYNWFNNSHLKPEIIYRIGSTIGYDFSKEFPELFTSTDFLKITNPHSFEAADSLDSANWKLKYISLLEQYNEILLQRMSA